MLRNDNTTIIQLSRPIQYDRSISIALIVCHSVVAGRDESPSRAQSRVTRATQEVAILTQISGRPASIASCVSLSDFCRRTPQLVVCVCLGVLAALTINAMLSFLWQ